MKPQSAINILNASRGFILAIMVACALLIAAVFIPICALLGGIMFVVEAVKGVCIGIYEAAKLTGATYTSIFTSTVKNMREMDDFIDIHITKIRHGGGTKLDYSEWDVTRGREM